MNSSSLEEFKSSLRKGNSRVQQVFERYERGENILTEEEEEECYKLECMENFIDYNDVEMTQRELGR